MPRPWRGALPLCANRERDDRITAPERALVERKRPRPKEQSTVKWSEVQQVDSQRISARDLGISPHGDWRFAANDPTLRKELFKPDCEPLFNNTSII